MSIQLCAYRLPPDRVFCRRGMTLVAAFCIALTATRVRAEVDSTVPQRVYLTATEPTSDHEDLFGNLLLRELVRQSVLIAARDGLGLNTRDMALREPFPTDAEAQSSIMHVSVHGAKDAKLEAELTQGTGDDRRVLWQTTYPMTTDILTFYVPLVEAAEEDSRGELIAALRKAGFAGEVNELVAKPGAFPEIDSSLSEFTFTSQFSAVRQLHRRVREEGESVDALAALARGYANLGFLSAFYWNASCKVFHARSLLYAERLLALQPEADRGHAVRGYARAMAGLHGLALQDFVKAEEQSQGKLPEWGRAAEAICRFDTTTLDEIVQSGSDAAQLAHCLRFLAYYSGGHNANFIAKATETQLAIPECYFVRERAGDFGGVSHLHQATLQGASILAARLSDRVASLPGLPESVKQRVAGASKGAGWLNIFGRRGTQPYSDVPSRIAAELVKAGSEGEDNGEPSWAVLGRMSEEIDFAFTADRLWFLKYSLSVPVDDFLAQVLPHFASHPYQGFLKSLGIDARAYPNEYRAALREVHLGDLYWTNWRFFSLARRIPVEGHLTAGEIWPRVLQQHDITSPDMETMLYWRAGDADSSLALAKEVLPISPHSPRFIEVLARHDDASEDQLREWEEENAAHVRVIWALADRYADDNRKEDAKRCYKKWISTSPDRMAYERLANLYSEEGEDELWRTTLEEYLTQPDYALDHAGIRVRIAQHFMRQKKWDRALPYAEAAAQTWAGWAMDCASLCHEGLQNWNESERWLAAEASRYPDSRIKWFLWCMRTGQGDADVARVAVDGWVAERNAETPPGKRELVGVYYLLTDRLKLALESFRSANEQHQTYWTALHVALVADVLGDTQLRDSVLKTFADYGLPKEENRSPAMAKFTILLHDWYLRGAEGEPNLNEIEEILADAAEAQRSDICYFLSQFLKSRGRKDMALTYLKRSYDSWELDRYNRSLAGKELSQLGLSLAELMTPATPVGD